MNKRIIMGILLIGLIGSMGAVMAVENNENVTYNHYGNGSYVFNDSNNDTVYGYCLNATKSSPSTGSKMAVSNDTSSIDNRIKELIVTFYRGDTTESYSYNVAIRTAIWNITNGQSLGGTGSLATSMMSYIENNPLGEIGDSYTFSDGVYNYIFNFYLGTASSSSTQPMLLFTYFNELIPEIPDEPEPVINETNTTINKTIVKEANVTINESIPNEITIINNNTNNGTICPDINITLEEIEFCNIEPKPPETNNTLVNMKNTGNNLIILALAIIGIVGILVIVRKR